MGRVKSISGNYGNPRTYTYDLAGNLTWIEEYELVKRYVYDEIYQLEKYVETYQSDVLANMTYYYDSVGNLTGRHDTYPNGVTYTENGNTYTLTDYDYYDHNYQYDAANRLELWYEEFGRVWPDGSYYDVICNRSDYMSYDNNGNMTKKEHGGNMEPNENHTYTYDILNRLEKHTVQGGAVTTYHYGSDGLRDKKTTGSDTIKYYCDENGIVLNEANANGSHRATNVVGADGTIIARKNQSGDIGKFIKNEHGDVTNVISETASNTYKYEPWGTITAKTGTFDNPIRYSGEYYDDESGLIYLRNRYYDPSLRRFISEDPHWNTGNMIYGDDPENKIPNIAAILQSSNLYAYCINNPVNYADPFGSVAYEKFATVKEAVADWVWNYKGITDYTLLELSSILYTWHDENGKLCYSYTYANVGDFHEVDPFVALAWVPEDVIAIGMIHSHPNNEGISESDIRVAENSNLDSYVVAPSGMVMRYGLNRQGTKWRESRFISYAPSATLSVKRKAELRDKFENKWWQHKLNCGHCQNKIWPGR